MQVKDEPGDGKNYVKIGGKRVERGKVEMKEKPMKSSGG